MALNGPVVVTGSGGFVGRRLCALLGAPSRLRMGEADWREALQAAPLEGAIVFHLAARVHERFAASEGEYRHDNVEKTEALAKAAARRGARHLVFLSSVKVLGEESRSPLGVDAPYAPQDPYGRSKREAEELLLARSGGAGFAVTIVRSPLVYGAGAGGNLAALRRWCDTPWPLPFGALHNRRSWIHVDDLAELLLACARSGAGEHRIVHAAHPEPLGTAQVIAGLRKALGRPVRMFAVPPRALEAMAGMAGRGETVRRLTRSLELDATATCAALGWRPRREPADALADLARGEQAR
jgi:nucleoside-diphosphate-sugar epimerase